MKNKTMCIILTVSILLLLILPSCNMEMGNIPRLADQKAQPVKLAESGEAPIEDALEEYENSGVNNEPEETKYYDYYDAEIPNETEIDYDEYDYTSDVGYTPPVEVVRDYYGIRMYENSDDICRVISSIRKGSEAFIAESMKNYGYNYAGLDYNEASIIAEGLVNTPLVLPKEEVEAEYFSITYCLSSNFIAISYRIDSVDYVFRYENAEFRSIYRVRNYAYVEESLGGIEFRMFPELNGEVWGIFDHADMSDRFIEVIIDGDNYDLDQFEFVYMPW